MIQSKADIVDDPRGALIGYENLLKNSSSPDAKVMINPDTWERFRPIAILNEVKFQLNASAEIDFIAIAAHNFATHDDGLEIEFHYATTIGGSKILIDSMVPDNNGAMMLTFDALDAAEIIIRFTPSTLGAEIGIISTGKLLRMPRNIYGGHSPISLSAKTSYNSTMSETGQFLSREITSQGSTGSFSWKLLNPDWYRSTFQPFVVSAKTKPFFIKWRPDMYSNEVAFGHTTGDIKPSNMGGGHTLMSVSFSMLSHEDV